MEVKDRSKLAKLAKAAEKVAGKTVMHNALRRVAQAQTVMEARRIAAEALEDIGDPVIIKIKD